MNRIYSWLLFSEDYLEHRCYWRGHKCSTENIRDGQQCLWGGLRINTSMALQLSLSILLAIKVRRGMWSIQVPWPSMSTLFKFAFKRLLPNWESIGHASVINIHTGDVCYWYTGWWFEESQTQELEEYTNKVVFHSLGTRGLCDRCPIAVELSCVDSY